MNLANYTTHGAFLPQIKCRDLPGAVGAMAAALEADGAIEDAASFVAEVLRREHEGSTAVGGGLVIPHARCAGVRTSRLAVATLAEPLDVGADDGRPADVIILLAGPPADPRQMLRILARLARLVRRETFLDGLRDARTPLALARAFAAEADELA